MEGIEVIVPRQRPLERARRKFRADGRRRVALRGGDALVGHERDRDRAPDVGEPRDVVARDRLLDERQSVRLEAADERRGLGRREALVEVDAERHPIAHGRADRRDAGDALADSMYEGVIFVGGRIAS